MASGVRHTGIRLAMALALAAGIALLATRLPVRALSGERGVVDLALVLAVDCSYSVDSREFLLQMRGLSSAFRRPEIQQAIARGDRGRIAVALVQWSDDANQLVAISWQAIATPEQARAFAAAIDDMPRNLAEGGTAIGQALEFSAAVLRSAPAATRRVIDMSSDGRNNRGVRPSLARDAVVAQGITINGLAIVNEWPTLDQYFEHQVVGGPGNFVIVANDYDAYAEAIYRKLLKEITGPGIS
jgi:hypothetical protein